MITKYSSRAALNASSLLHTSAQNGLRAAASLSRVGSRKRGCVSFAHVAADVGESTVQCAVPPASPPSGPSTTAPLRPRRFSSKEKAAHEKAEQVKREASRQREAVFEVQALPKGTRVPREPLRNVPRGAIAPDTTDSSLQLSQHNTLASGLKSADLHLSRAFAAGHVFTPALLDKLLAESYYNPRIVHVMELLIQGDANRNKLHTRAIPSRFHGRPFSELFEHFVRALHLLPLALYRDTKDSSSMPVYYCYTNPIGQAILAPGDRVFVVGRAESDVDPIPKHAPRASPWVSAASAAFSPQQDVVRRPRGRQRPRNSWQARCIPLLPSASLCSPLYPSVSPLLPSASLCSPLYPSVSPLLPSASLCSPL